MHPPGTYACIHESIRELSYMIASWFDNRQHYTNNTAMQDCIYNFDLCPPPTKTLEPRSKHCLASLIMSSTISFAGLTSCWKVSACPSHLPLCYSWRMTYIDECRDISHEPHSAFHRFLGVLFELDIVRDLSLGREFLTARVSFWWLYSTRRTCQLTFLPHGLPMI